MVIYDDYAYERAVAAKIARNRATGIAQRKPAKREAFLAVEGNAALIEQMQGLRDRDSFVEKLLWGYEEYGSLTEKQLDAAKRAVERRRLWDKTAQAQAQAEGGASEWFLALGERAQFAAEIIRKNALDARSFSYHGVVEDRWMYTLRTAEGHIVVYFGTSDLGSVGDNVSLRATVKKLDTYRGVKQTVITRPHKIEGEKA